MAFILKPLKTLRNNWKKSTFAAGLLSYGYGYTRDYLETQELMRVYCEKAARYGLETIPVEKEPRTVTVILNPSANKRKASDEFDKYCAPILHLAGLNVDIIKTESEGHARNLIGTLENTDAVIIAGGDGTFSEVITGLLRRTQENTNGLIPLGVLPLGKTNTVASLLFPAQQHLAKVRALAEASMAIVEESVQPINVLKVEVIDGDNKPIYVASGIKWGAFRDAGTKRDSYWVYGGLRKYATYIFNGYKSTLTWSCSASLNYTLPCTGCSNCVRNQQRKWFDRFSKDTQPNYRNIKNPECQTVHEENIDTVDFTLSVPSLPTNEVPKFVISVGPKDINYWDFVREGCRSENGHQRAVSEVIEARTVQIVPNVGNEQVDRWFSIDNENFELKAVKVTLLPKLINVFCKKEIV